MLRQIPDAELARASRKYDAGTDTQYSKAIPYFDLMGL
jgi:hypothetical protein